MEETRPYQMIAHLTAEQKHAYDSKRKAEGKTAQGCLAGLILKYINEATDGNTKP